MIGWLATEQNNNSAETMRRWLGSISSIRPVGEGIQAAASVYDPQPCNMGPGSEPRPALPILEVSPPVTAGPTGA